MTNINKRTFIYLLPLLMLACTLTGTGRLTAQVTPAPPQIEREAVNMAAVIPTELAETPAPTPTPTPQVCQVKTGIEAGALNIRACGGVDCPVLAVLYEGETLSITQAMNGWLDVETASGLRGWVNSSYCEVTK